MSELSSFIAAALAAPTDSALRLVFADWLEDQADPRAGCLCLAVRLRAMYGPRHTGNPHLDWDTLGAGIEPVWWVEETRRLVKEVADRHGDGSKSAALIALALTEAGLLLPEGWGGPDALRLAANQAVEAVDRLSVLISTEGELTRCIQSAAMGNEVLAHALTAAFSAAGRDGCISIERVAPPPHATVRSIWQFGLRFPLSGQVEGTGELRPVRTLVSERPLQAEEVRRALSECERQRGGLLCLCPGLDADGGELLRNATHGGRAILWATSAGRWRDCFEDIAFATRAWQVDADVEGPIEFTSGVLGRAESARVDGGHLVIEPPFGQWEGGEEKIDHLRQRVEETQGEEQQWHAYRLGQITGGIVTIEVGCAQPADTERLYWLACGALHAGREAVASGYVPGGGVAYLRAAAACPEGPAGQALRWALEEPLRAHLADTGLDVNNTLHALRADNQLGFDVVSKELPRWRDAGPTDPTSSVRGVILSAIESAIRAAEAEMWPNRVR
jgi:chaperonin GroEL